MDWKWLLLPAVLLAVLLAGCSATTSGRVPDSQLGRLRRVQITTPPEHLAAFALHAPAGGRSV